MTADPSARGENGLYFFETPVAPTGLSTNRTHSAARPKPLHVLCGRPMLLHVLDALAELPIERTVVVVGHEAELSNRTRCP